MLAGLAGLGMTMAGMIEIYNGQTNGSAPALAEGISGSLIPASIGAPLFLAGLILVLLGWWRGLGAKRSTGVFKANRAEQDAAEQPATVGE